MIQRFGFVLLVWISFRSFAHDQETFLQANKLYQEEQYEQALNKYLSIHRPASAVWYNAGNAAYQLGRHAQSVLYWARAQGQAKTYQLFDDCQHNINVTAGPNSAAKNVRQKIAEWLRRFVCVTPTLQLQLVMMLLGLASFGLLLWSGARRWLALASVGCATLLVVALLLYGLVYPTCSRVQAVVMKDTDVFEGPSPRFNQVGICVSPQVVTIVDERKDWYKMVGHDIRGWVEAESLERV